MKILSVPQSGSRAGVTAAASRSGQILRRRAIPVHPLTFAHNMPARSAFSASTRLWSTLTPAQQAAWNASALTHSASLGPVSSAGSNGKALFVGCQTALRVLKRTPPTTPPASWGRSVITMRDLSATHLGSVSGHFDGVAPASSIAVIEACASQSPGSSIPGDFVYLSHQVGSFTGFFDISTPYGLRFGLPITGWRVWVRVHILSNFGVQGVRSAMMATVT